MFEVTQDNYHRFLTWHGHDLERAKLIVDTHDNTPDYHNILSIKLWVDASKIVLKNNIPTQVVL